MSTKKHPKPPRVRAKVDLKKKLDKKLEQSQGYLSAQATADPQNDLGVEAKALEGRRKVLLDAIKKRTDVKAQLDLAQADVVTADSAHDEAMRDYATAAAKKANGDPSVLASLGVALASKPVKNGNGAVGAPKGLTITPGALQGEAILSCDGVAHAGAYEFAYKLEPSQPADPWTQGGLTTYVSTTVANLPAEQKIRARVRAVGATPGPWSAEVVGSAR